jgi:hypothetical protein
MKALPTVLATTRQSELEHLTWSTFQRVKVLPGLRTMVSRKRAGRMSTIKLIKALPTVLVTTRQSKLKRLTRSTCQRVKVLPGLRTMVSRKRVGTQCRVEPVLIRWRALKLAAKLKVRGRVPSPRQHG